MRKNLFILYLIILLCCGTSEAKPTKKSVATNTAKAKIGMTLPAWSEGWLDIHFINSARGEFYLYMLDDSNFDYRVKSIHGPYKSR